ncbi:GLABRA2 expression modulator-like isoform X2 [Cucumis melo var. makuwa]|uniref:GLABRA2 expression modulator-like isoform X2 n=1 Tax=Cucumis melo var. makuwa TaxID=1194695 RepID=A0A5D3CRE5_CUCMM|nr:GLABRA2 expression modulator-like isoform X2 [Cucumis melo var. makuwa]
MVGEELLVGAALGALLGELLKRVLNLMEKTVHFKPELEGLKSQVEFLMPLMDQVDELGEDFKLRYSDQTLKLKILINKGKAGANFVDAFVGRAVEHIKDDPKEGIEGKIEEKIKKWGEGRFEKIFHRTFETTIVAAEEKLHIWFACNLSTTREKGENIETVAVAGVLFVSSAKLAFCSLKPTPVLHSSTVNTQSLYLKVVIPFELLKDVEFDGDQKCIRVIAIDDQKFEFMNFRNYNVAKEGIQHIPLAPIWTH